MQTMPAISSYGQYASSNYGLNTLRVDVGNLTIWFSYKTPVAFQKDYGPIIVSENIWGPTTGKHLNWINGGAKTSRLPREEFERQLSEAMP